MTRALISIVSLLVCLAHPAMAEGRSVLRIGGMELAYDGTRWQAGPSLAGDITLRPIGAIARTLDAVRVHHVPADEIAACEGAARKELAGGIYDEAEVQQALVVSGADAVRLEAWARCRNAMPRAVALCAVHGGSGYLFVVREHSCQTSANNLSSGIDPLQDLIDGVRFLP